MAPFLTSLTELGGVRVWMENNKPVSQTGKSSTGDEKVFPSADEHCSWGDQGTGLGGLG